MKIGGLQKFSLIDYPKKMAAVIFTQGCPFLCHFCHNPTLVLPNNFMKPIPEKEILDFLNKRKTQLNAVVITGGEPTVQKDLKSFIQKIKDLNFSVKLDTAGINPKILKDLIDNSFLDYVAMDIKAPLEKYEKIINRKIDTKKILQSIKVLLNSNIEYEFRTTLVHNLHTMQDPIEISKLIKHAPLYVLQKFVPNNTLNPDFKNHTSFLAKDLLNIKKQIEKNVKVCNIR